MAELCRKSRSRRQALARGIRHGEIRLETSARHWALNKRLCTQCCRLKRTKATAGTAGSECESSRSEIEINFSVWRSAVQRAQSPAGQDRRGSWRPQSSYFQSCESNEILAVLSVFRCAEGYVAPTACLSRSASLLRPVRQPTRAAHRWRGSPLKVGDDETAISARNADPQPLPPPIMSAGLDQRSNWSAVTSPEASAAARSVLPSRCARLAIAAARS